MIKYTLLLLIGSTCNISLLPQVQPGELSINRVFVEWNKATLKSLALQKVASADSTLIASLDNRSWGIPLYWDIASPDSVNKKSVRYRFLDKLSSEDLPKDIYVVEANSNGSKRVIRSFVIYKNKVGHYQARLYMYFGNQWEMRKITELDTCFLSPKLNNFIAKRGLGFNSDDIIISHITGGVRKVQESEYYLGGTLAMDSGIKELIDHGY